MTNHNFNQRQEKPNLSTIPILTGKIDPLLPCTEPDLSQADGIFGKRFGIQFMDGDSRFWFARAASTAELLSMYSIPPQLLNSISIVIDDIDNIDQLLAGGMPYQLRTALLSPDHQTNCIEDNFVEGQDEQVFSVQCYHTCEDTDTRILKWDKAY